MSPRMTRGRRIESARGHAPAPQRPPAPRGGFSLIELMVVIVIISILLGLLLPAIGRVRTNVRIADVRTEISALESAITQFVGEFGQEPPSHIRLCEIATDWDTESKTTIRQLWPQFDFTIDRDLNQDGDKTDPPKTLTGDECLLFFLGGPGTIVFFNPTTKVYGDQNGDGKPEITPGSNGFSKNPQDPFAKGGGRTGPFHEFDPDRMVDVDGDEVFSYADKIPSSQIPYLYLSSNGGRGYRILDADFNENGTLDSPGELGNVYRQSAEVAWKDKSYQIISAGYDGEFGAGGGWSSAGGVADKAAMASDRDNITNFASGTLD